MAGADVVEGSIASFLHACRGFLQFVGHSLGACHERFHGFAHLSLFKFAGLCEVRTVGDIADGGNHLQLRRTLVDRGDAGIAVVALDGVVHHKARTAVNLDGVVSVLVAIFRVHALGEWRERIGQFAEVLLFHALLRREFAFAGDVVKRLVDVNVAGALIKQCAAGVELGFHEGQHVVNGGEIDDGFAKLLTVAGIGQTFVVGGL